MRGLSAEDRRRINERMMRLPGKRGIDVPEHIHDRIYPVAAGITRQLWGRPPTPQQIQHLYDHGLHTPEQIHEAYGNLPHPHAPAVRVREYADYARAWQLYRQTTRMRSR